jgi:hypothetical protein
MAPEIKGMTRLTRLLYTLLGQGLRYRIGHELTLLSRFEGGSGVIAALMFLLH